jgi:XTP/dITP diphosphohydrolase
MIELVIGTANPHKRREIESILAGTPVVCLGPGDVGAWPDVIEDRDTLEGNAAKKACEVAGAVDRLVVADDSGLEVDALDGRPGVYSARYAGPECNYAANNEKLLRELEGVPDHRRTAAFRCVMALASPSGLLFSVQGRVEGRITTAPRGAGGFGYDPVFLYPPTGRTFAEMPPDRKNSVSHRHRALEAFQQELLARIERGEIEGA